MSDRIVVYECVDCGYESTESNIEFEKHFIKFADREDGIDKLICPNCGKSKFEITIRDWF